MRRPPDPIRLAGLLGVLGVVLAVVGWNLTTYVRTAAQGSLLMWLGIAAMIAAGVLWVRTPEPPPDEEEEDEGGEDREE